jgi:hypothetical protein
MYRKEVNEQSPLRILEASMHGGLGRGKLGVVVSRVGVGKTACLVQIGLDDLMRDKKVLHLALDGQNVDHVQSWYSALFEDLAHHTHLEDRQAVSAAVARGSIIHAQASPRLTPEQLDRVLKLYVDQLGFRPDALLVDGYDWTGSVASTAATLSALKAAARRLEAELWMTARTTRADTASQPSGLVAPLGDYAELIDVVLLLEPESDHVSIRLLKDHDSPELAAVNLELQCDTMRLVRAGTERAATRLPATTCKLLSGAARGAEAEFGACAEKWGVQECNFSFDGRPVARQRGVVLLSSQELEKGAVSMAYLESHMHRSYPRTPLFRKVLQTIWHQVNTAGQVFVVGLVLEDGTVKGGTGWAPELAKHLHKPVFVFDQEKKVWLSWLDEGWREVDPPTIRSRRFAGTGTRNLSDEGKQAIHDLFARSFA